MKNEQQIWQKLAETEGKLNLNRDELLKEFSGGLSEEGQRRLMPLAPYAESTKQGMVQSLIRMQAKGRAEGWLDALHWVMEASANSKQPDS